MNFKLLPWLMPQSDRLRAQVGNGTLPHALLISGPASSGKTLLMQALLARLLCTAGNSPCDNCHQCHLLKAGTHPDYLLIAPEDSKQILIDQIRGLIEWVVQTSQQGGQKICVVSPAHRMNVQAANSLLKCLEEPPKATTVVLITDEPNRLLPTIRSRCQHVVCHAPERKDAILWLQQQRQSDMEPELLLEIADGVPLRAIEVIDTGYLELRGRIAEALPLVLSSRTSPIQMAAGFSGDDPGSVLDIMYQLTADTISYSLSAASWRNHDLIKQLEKLATSIDLDARFEFLNRLCRAREMLGSNSNANPQMLFEWVLAA